MTEAIADVTREQVGPYRLVRAIGAGGSARIDLARIDRAYGFQRHVVIKRPLEHLRADKTVAASLAREARLGGRLRHPNLVAVLDAGTHDRYDYLVLEYVHGAPLRTLMQEDDAPGRVRDLPVGVSLGVAIDVARGMHEAHELRDERGASLGLVHRDVSPGNVLVGLDGSVKLADFGIAKETRVATLSGSMHGTVTYMAPEQCRGHAFDRRADVFSLGVILYELITRTRLFWADNDVASLHRVLSGQVIRPRKIDPSIPAALEEIVMTAVAHAPDQRFVTARALADALESFAADQGYLVGARWVAHAMEEIVGVKRAPWVAATTVSDGASLVEAVQSAGASTIADPVGDRAPGTSGRSLVAVIEALEAEHAGDSELLLPTFGPTDPIAVEEPARASIAASTQAPTPRRQHTWIAGVIAAGVIAGVGAAIAIDVSSTSTSTSAAPAPVPAPAAAPVAAPAPAPVPAAAPLAAPAPDPAPVAAPALAPPPPSPAPARKHRRRTGSSPPAHVDEVAIPNFEAAPPAPPSPPANGSAVQSGRSTHVEWKPTMLLPTDSGSATKQK